MPNEYVTRLMGYVGGRSPIDLLRVSRDDIESVVAAISAQDRIDNSYGEGKWTARQIVCHLADAEVGIGYRMRQVITSDNHVIQPFDEKEWAANYGRADIQTALRSFLALREWNLEILRAIAPSVWNKPYHHPEQGDMIFEMMIKLLAGHDINHLNQLKQIAAAR